MSLGGGSGSATASPPIRHGPKESPQRKGALARAIAGAIHRELSRTAHYPINDNAPQINTALLSASSAAAPPITTAAAADPLLSRPELSTTQSAVPAAELERRAVSAARFLSVPAIPPPNRTRASHQLRPTECACVCVRACVCLCGCCSCRSWSLSRQTVREPVCGRGGGGGGGGGGGDRVTASGIRIDSTISSVNGGGGATREIAGGLRFS